MMADAAVFARGVLADLDEQVASIEAVLLDGQATDWVTYRELVARRAALRRVRVAVLERVGRSGRDLLGVAEERARSAMDASE